MISKNTMMTSRNLFFILIGLLFALPTSLQAQCCGAQYSANEIGMRLGSVKSSSTLPGQIVNYNPSAFVFAPLSGVHYKRYFQWSAFRASFGYQKEQIEGSTDCIDCFGEVSAKLRGGDIRLGWEAILALYGFEPYIGFDVVGSYEKFTGVVSGTGVSGNYEVIDHDDWKYGIGISPFFGMRYFFGYAVSVSAETSLDAMFYQITQKATPLNPAGKTQTLYTTGSEALFNPVSTMSINVLF